MENSTLFTSLDLGARLKGKPVEMRNVHNFVGVVFHMGVVCRDKIEKPKYRGARFIYMKERSLTDDEIVEYLANMEEREIIVSADFMGKRCWAKSPELIPDDE